MNKGRSSRTQRESWGFLKSPVLSVVDYHPILNNLVYMCFRLPKVGYVVGSSRAQGHLCLWHLKSCLPGCRARERALLWDLEVLGSVASWVGVLRNLSAFVEFHFLICKWGSWTLFLWSPHFCDFMIYLYKGSCAVYFPLLVSSRQIHRVETQSYRSETVRWSIFALQTSNMLHKWIIRSN